MFSAVTARRPVELRQHLVRQALAAADHPDLDVLVHQLGPLDDQEMPEQPHQELELARRPLPVLDREAVERELLEPEPASLLDDGADALDAPAMPHDPGQAPPLGPSAVAVHDDRDVPGKLLGTQAHRGDPRQAFVGDRQIFSRCGHGFLEPHGRSARRAGLPRDQHACRSCDLPAGPVGYEDRLPTVGADRDDRRRDADLLGEELDVVPGSRGRSDHWRTPVRSSDQPGNVS